jgi:hypothetical protein
VDECPSQGPSEALLKTQISSHSQLTRTNTFSPCDEDPIKIEIEKQDTEAFKNLVHRQPLYQTSFGGADAEIMALPFASGSVEGDEQPASSLMESASVSTLKIKKTKANL